MREKESEGGKEGGVRERYVCKSCRRTCGSLNLLLFVVIVVIVLVVISMV